MGSFLLLILGGWFGLDPVTNFKNSDAFLPLLGMMIVLMGIGLFKLNMHLGKPHRFYRGFYNLKMSPVSREIAGVSAFFGGLLGYSFFCLFDGTLATILQTLFAGIGLLGLTFGGYYMYKLYRIEARPFWNHWYTAASFSATALTLGSLLITFSALIFGVLSIALAQTLLLAFMLGILLEAVGLMLHAHDMQAQNSEGIASFYEQTTSFAYPYWLRNGILAIVFALGLAMLSNGNTSVLAYSLLAVLALASNLISRALFYVVVIPTTMPGAFFWKNKGFVEHARESGLADMPQMGVAYEQHHAFKVANLLKTVTQTSLQDKWSQFRRVFTG